MGRSARSPALHPAGRLRAKFLHLPTAPRARRRYRSPTVTDDSATILLVDDRDANLLALEAVLEPLGHPLIKARSGREALRFLLDHDCALILLDVQMPELDGFETAALIRQRERSRYTPIIFVTAVRREEEQILKGYANGAVDYVVKPFTPEVMVAKVTYFLEQHRRERALKAEAAQRVKERDEFERRERMARAEADAHREHLYALFMKAPAAIAIVRGPQQTILLANPTFERLVGKSDLQGRPGREAIPGRRRRPPGTSSSASWPPAMPSSAPSFPRCGGSRSRAPIASSTSSRSRRRATAA